MCLISKLRKVVAESVTEFFKSVNIWQSYKQERDCLVHFARLTNTLLKDEESARDNCVLVVISLESGSVAEWLECWTQAQKGSGSNRNRDAVGNSLRQTVHTHCASLHQAAKLVAAILRVAGVTARLAESNGSLPPGL